jgi:alkylation response protein AidB-like acyl-CoA dehydrogenase
MISELLANRWLEPLRPAVSELSERDLVELKNFEVTLQALMSDYPVNAALESSVRSRHLRQIRRSLADAGYLALAIPFRSGGRGHPAVIQALLQFICGYYDVDLRDSSGLGHGRLIADHATLQVRDQWLPSLLAGAIPGIAITEPCGGSQIHAIKTTAVATRGPDWQVSGTKTWISRLTEAALFCVFFTDPAGQLTAAVVDAASPGLVRKAIAPAGLSGWAWGELRLCEVIVQPRDILGQPGQGMQLLRDHFARYRPLVAATALGAAAATHDQTSTWLSGRRLSGAIEDFRDNALITLGQTYAQINAALLAALTAYRLADADSPMAHRWGCTTKAHGVEVAYQAASELALLVGASSFTADCRMAKARRDLDALHFADGIHDSLYRAAGRSLTQTFSPSFAASGDLVAAGNRETLIQA